MEDSWLQQQMDEFACMQSMFPDANELVFDQQLYDQHMDALLNDDADTAVTLKRFQYALRFPSTGTDTPELQIAYPLEYPDIPVQFSMSWPSCSRSEMESLRHELQEIATAAPGDVIVLQLYQRVLDAITDQQSRLIDDRTLDSPYQQENPSAPVILGRRAIYFHHIINENKRRVVTEWALELQLGGFSKIGWPGIVIVEGAESDCQEYVRRLQHLRWQQMVVRGEQTQQGETLDAMRMLPKGFQEFPTHGMSALTAACAASGVTELFLTTMKIYKERSDVRESTAQK